MRSIVVLPAPFWPNNPKNSPRSTRRSIPRKASTSPKRFVRWTASITATTRGRKPRYKRVAPWLSETAGRTYIRRGRFVPIDADGPLRLRREHVPKRPVGSDVQPGRATGLDRGERRGAGRAVDQPGRSRTPPGDRHTVGAEDAAARDVGRRLPRVTRRGVRMRGPMPHLPGGQG